VVALSNVWRRNSNPVPNIVTHEIFDRLLGQRGGDWRDRGREMNKRVAKRLQERKSKSAKERKEGTSPTHALADLAGTYRHPAHGDLRVEVADKELRLVFSGATVVARHYHYNTFAVVDTLDLPAAMLEDRKLTFLVGRKGVIDRLQITMEVGVQEFTFQRVEKQAKRGGKQ
jgi:hypothetical protein